MNKKHLRDENILKKSYKVRVQGAKRRSIVITIPREFFEREVRRLGLTFEEAIETLRAVWRYNSSSELRLSFEAPDISKNGLEVSIDDS
jgi:hypothetical protein